MSCETCSRTTRGWLGGCFAATAVIELFFLFILSLAVVNRFAALSPGDFVFAILFGVPVILFFVGLFSGIPSIAAIWLSERLRIRSPVFFGSAGGLIGAGSNAVFFGSFSEMGWLLVLAGCLAGLQYWYVAGRYAGNETRRPRH